MSQSRKVTKNFGSIVGLSIPVLPNEQVVVGQGTSVLRTSQNLIVGRSLVSSIVDVSVSSTTDAVSSSVGALTIAGGAFVGKTLITGGLIVQQGLQLQTVTTGNTVQISSTVPGAFATAGSTLSALTVNLPVTPVDGQTIFFSCNQTITSTTITAIGKTVSPIYTGSALGAGSALRYIYISSTSTWYQV